jgi:ferrochelatase
MSQRTEKIAVILFNLGGPDSLEAVKPFLYNLFSDPAIIQLPPLLRQIVAKLISSLRASTAQKIYAKLGGKTPLLANTLHQKLKLEEWLKENEKNHHFQIFTVMRYWHPRATEVIDRVCQFDPDQIVLLPLYPQFSTTTTASSLKEWQELTRGRFEKTEVKTVCCYHSDDTFIQSHVQMLKEALDHSKAYGIPRVLFTAHGLPQKVVDKGDPYEWQIHQSVGKILEKMDEAIDYTICYQSRVGPLKWLEPSIENEVKRAGKELKPLIVLPISFVSEHSETLVELDQEYALLAKTEGVPHYYRVPTLSVHPLFIRALGERVLAAINNKQPSRTCPSKFKNAGTCAHD